MTSETPDRNLVEQLKEGLRPKTAESSETKDQREAPADQTAMPEATKKSQDPYEKTREKETQIMDRINLALEGKDFTRMDADDLMELELTEKGDGLLAALFLEKNDGARPSFFTDISDIQQEYAPGTELRVDFQGNSHAEQIIGAGDMLPPRIRTIITVDDKGNRRIGIRQNSPRVGYYDRTGDYMEVFTGYKIIIPTQEYISGMSTPEPIDKAFFKNIFFTDDDVRENSVDESASKHEFIEKVATNKEKGRVSFFEYLSMEFPEFASLKKEDLNLTQKASEQDLKKIAEIMGITGAQYSLLQRTFQSITEQESNGRYDALGTQVWSPSHFGQRAIGAHQVMPNNWGPWGKSLSSRFPGNLESMNGLLLPSARNQDLVAFMKMAEYFQQYKHMSEIDRVQMVAISWFGNPTGAKTPDKASTRKYSGKSPADYRDDIKARVFG